MHRMVVMRSDMARTRNNFSIIMHLSMGPSHLLLHHDVWISVKT